jgi:hypothetical protein
MSPLIRNLTYALIFAAIAFGIAIQHDEYNYAFFEDFLLLRTIVYSSVVLVLFHLLRAYDCIVTKS